MVKRDAMGYLRTSYGCVTHNHNGPTRCLNVPGRSRRGIVHGLHTMYGAVQRQLG